MKHHLLIVEDSPFSREMLGDWLELQGFEVEAVASLAEAMEVLESGQPDAVLLDVQLGTDDGLSLAGWMRHRETSRHTPVIAVTAHAMVVDQERILKAGCNACLSKPIEFDSLREQLQKWLMVSSVMKGAESLSFQEASAGDSHAQ